MPPRGNPAYTLRSDLAGVRALPLLRSAADFDKLDGKMQAKIAVRSTGTSQRAIMSNLDGTVFAMFQDGAIRGLNVAQMIRSLTSGTLSGWQEGKEQTTDLTQLSASFRIEKGQATTTDLNLVGPLVKMTGAGTVDLGTKMLAFRVEPKLVMTTEGQGRAADPVGLGIPVVDRRPLGRAAHLSRHGRHPGQSRCGLCQAQGDGQGPVRRQRRRLGGLGGLGGGSSSGSGGSNDALGGKLGETLGNLLQQGLGQRPRHSIAKRRSDSGASRPAHAGAERLHPAGRAGQPADERRAAAVVQSVMSSSCPGLSRASTSLPQACKKTWMAGTSPAMTEVGAPSPRLPDIRG